MSAQDASAKQWLVDSLGQFDAFNADGIASVFAEDAVLNFASIPEIQGRDNIKAVFASQFPHLSSMKHTVNHVHTIGNKIYQQADIAYTVKGDTSVPAEIVLKAFFVHTFAEAAGWEQGKSRKMVAFEAYLDPSALNERVKAVLTGA